MLVFESTGRFPGFGMWDEDEKYPSGTTGRFPGFSR
jgi:hypothetical protein